MIVATYTYAVIQRQNRPYPDAQGDSSCSLFHVNHCRRISITDGDAPSCAGDVGKDNLDRIAVGVRSAHQLCAGLSLLRWLCVLLRMERTDIFVSYRSLVKVT